MVAPTAEEGVPPPAEGGAEEAKAEEATADVEVGESNASGAGAEPAAAPVRPPRPSKKASESDAPEKPPRPSTEPAAEPDAAPAAEPASEPAAEPASEPEAEPEGEPVAQPTTDAAPAAEAAAEPEAAAAAEPAADAAPAAETTAEPETAAEPAVEPAADAAPAAETAADAETAAEPAVEPAADAESTADAEPASEPEPESETVAEEPTAEAVLQPAEPEPEASTEVTKGDISSWIVETPWLERMLELTPRSNNGGLACALARVEAKLVSASLEKEKVKGLLKRAEAAGVPKECLAEITRKTEKEKRERMKEGTTFTEKYTVVVYEEKKDAVKKEELKPLVLEAELVQRGDERPAASQWVGDTLWDHYLQSLDKKVRKDCEAKKKRGTDKKADGPGGVAAKVAFHKECERALAYVRENALSGLDEDGALLIQRCYLEDANTMKGQDAPWYTFLFK